MAAIRPCTGTTADWKAVEDTLILKEREVGVEIDTSGHYLVRQGDGKNKFFDLPIIVNNARYEEILELTQGYMNTVNNFSKNIHIVDGKKMVRTIGDLYLSGESEHVQFEQL